MKIRLLHEVNNTIYQPDFFASKIPICTFYQWLQWSSLDFLNTVLCYLQEIIMASVMIPWYLTGFFFLVCILAENCLLYGFCVWKFESTFAVRNDCSSWIVDFCFNIRNVLTLIHAWGANLSCCVKCIDLELVNYFHLCLFIRWGLFDKYQCVLNQLDQE